MLPLPTQQPSHSYATRIRQNISIKPSARLRNDPEPPQLHRRPKHQPPRKSRNADAAHPFPQFPPPNVVLHPDDANSRVFLAIGRSFLSVDNRAMTIKDLAEMTVKFGLACQKCVSYHISPVCPCPDGDAACVAPVSVSAASQAITTYIRQHMQRCEQQQDHPLLLRHTLSGTAADDDLLPALHSRSGGASCAAHPENRATNFRRGTIVWYLSRATGAPCPFSRAGIRLCDYTEDGKVGCSTVTKDRKKQCDREKRAAQCGEKRKRPFRACAAKGSDSDSPNEDDQRPPKVKLTLRLKPLHPSSEPSSGPRQVVDLSKDSDSDDSDQSRSDSMSVESSDESSGPANSKPEEESWSLPPYPRRAISIPPYTPSYDDTYAFYSASYPSTRDLHRSPSVARSTGSPPPDSDDEDDEVHASATKARHRSSRAYDADFDWDADLDSEGEGDTVWESPGPRSPSVSVSLDHVKVKEEPNDVQGMLDAWDYYDSGIADAKIVQIGRQSGANSGLGTESASKIKTESLDTWSWSPVASPSDGLVPRIKEEEFDLDPLSFPECLPEPQLSPELERHRSLFPGSSSDTSAAQSPRTDDSREFDSDRYDHDRQSSVIRPRIKTAPMPFSYFSDSPSEASSTGQSKIDLSSASSISQSLASLVQSLSMSSPTSIAPSSLILPQPCVSPRDTRRSDTIPSDVVVVNTCQPCTPPIIATQIEGIPVYRMILGSFSFLRRIDTDFVNLSPITAYSGAPYPVLSTVPNAVTITKGTPTVSGIWVPLGAAQAFTQDHPLEGGPLDVFLSDVLFERFPTALQDFHRLNRHGRLLNQFGPHFGSTLQASQLLDSTTSMLFSWSPEQLAMQRPSGSIVNGSPAPPEKPVVDDVVNTPLSPTEQEIFHALCVFPDWESKEAEDESASGAVPPESGMEIDEEKIPVDFAPVDQTTAETPQESGALGSSLKPTPPPLRSAGKRMSPSPTQSRPLRRSKRVAEAKAAAAQVQVRTRPRRGGSRNSLS